MLQFESPWSFRNRYYFLNFYESITKPFTHLNQASSTSTQLISTSTQLHPAHFSLHPALCNTLKNIWAKILHVIGQFPQI